MNFNFQKATKTQLRARVAIDGPSGAGKTYTALVLATALAGANGKIAVIDTERGSAKLYADKFVFDVLEMDEFSPSIYVQAIESAEQAGYQVVVIDSLTHAWEGEGGALDLVDKASARLQNNSYAAWKDVTPMHRRMVDAMLQSKCHIVATMRSKMDYVQEKNENGRTVIRKVGMAPIQRQGMEYEFTLVGDMDVDHKFIVSKSRCDIFADFVKQKPTVKDFEPFVKWLDEGIQSPANKQPEPTPQPAPKYEQPESAKQKRPFAPDKLKSDITAAIAKYESEGRTCDPKDRQMVAANLDSILGDTDKRHTMLKWLVGEASTMKIPSAAIQALKKWINVQQDKDGSWIADANSMVEARRAYDAALVAQGQMTIEGAA